MSSLRTIRWYRPSMRIGITLIALCLVLSACAPSTQVSSQVSFPIKDGERWFVSSQNEEKTQEFQKEIRIRGQPEQLPNGNSVFYFDDQQSFFLLQENSAYLLVRYKTNGLNYDSDQATFCRFLTQINPIGDGLWVGSGFFGTTRSVIQQANANPTSKLSGFCAMLKR